MQSKKFPINAVQPIESRDSRSLLDHRKILAELVTKAKEHGRELMSDVFRIISIYLTQGNNIDKIMELPFTSAEVKERLSILKNIYHLKNNPLPDECTLTLSRVADAFPHISLVISDMLNSAVSGSHLRFCVTAKDLGANVHYHFKMNYFSSLIDVDAGGLKAQVALLVHNLCHSRGILNTGGGKNIGAAFAASCKISSRMNKMRMAPASARAAFTAYIIENFNFDADSLCRLWDRVIGDTKILLCGTLITPFHEQVLNRQPLYVSKWRDLLNNRDSD